MRGRKITAKFPFRSHERRTEKAGRPGSFCSFGQKGNQRRNYSHPNHERRSRIVPLNRVTNYYGTSVARLQSDQRPLNIILLDAGSGDLKRTDRERERERERERDRPDILIRFKPRLPNKGLNESLASVGTVDGWRPKLFSRLHFANRPSISPSSHVYAIDLRTSRREKGKIFLFERAERDEIFCWM